MVNYRERLVVYIEATSSIALEYLFNKNELETNLMLELDSNI